MAPPSKQKRNYFDLSIKISILSIYIFRIEISIQIFRETFHIRFDLIYVSIYARLGNRLNANRRAFHLITTGFRYFPHLGYFRLVRLEPMKFKFLKDSPDFICLVLVIYSEEYA